MWKWRDFFTCCCFAECLGPTSKNIPSECDSWLRDQDTATVWLVGWELARQEHIKLRALFLARDSQCKDSRVFPDSCKHVKSETVFELGVAICGIPIKWQFFPPVREDKCYHKSLAALHKRKKNPTTTSDPRHVTFTFPYSCVNRRSHILCSYPSSTKATSGN